MQQDDSRTRSTRYRRPTAARSSQVKRSPAPSLKLTSSTPIALSRSAGLTCEIPRPGTCGLELIPTSLPGSNAFRQHLATRSLPAISA